MCDLNDNPIKLSLKWNGKEFDIPEFSPSDSVAMLKIAIENATGVRPERQKLLNVKFQGNWCIFSLITISHPLKHICQCVYYIYLVVAEEFFHENV